MFGFTKYNYDTFTREILAKQVARSRFFGGPEPGDRAPDFQARALDGKTIRLSNYRGSKNVVLTLGSATCPMTTGSIGGMNDLRQDYHRQGCRISVCLCARGPPRRRSSGAPFAGGEDPGRRPAARRGRDRDAGAGR